MLNNIHIGLFITGGIAAYKMPNFARTLIKEGAQVRAGMTQAACQFITPLTMQTLTKRPVLIDTFIENHPEVVQHIDFADWCDFAIVAPATANIIGKMATGIGDDAVSSTLLALHVPTLIAPAMNMNMYNNPAVQTNLATLKQRGYTIIEPDTGFLAEGYEGKGRLPDDESLLNQIKEVVARNRYKQVLAGKKVAISAGGTIERIDPVRYISNDSSGKMGYALAQAARWLGADVTLVSTTNQLSVPNGVKRIKVESANDMHQAMRQAQKEADILMMAAAVSDYRVDGANNQKMKKQDFKDGLTLQLVENPDILKDLVAHRTNNQLIVGFAAETQHVIEFAREKLNRKGVDWIVANDVNNQSIGFNSDENQVTLLSKNSREIPLQQASKSNIAIEIFQTIMENIEE